MANTVSYSINAQFSNTVGITQITPVLVSLTVGGAVSMNRMTATFAASVAVPLGSVATPTAAYLYNADATNYIVILDDTTEIGRLPAGKSQFFFLPSGVTLKVQANTANCLLDFAVYDAA